MNSTETVQRIRGWRDSYSTKVDAELRGAWPKLEIRLRDAVGSLPISSLTRPKTVVEQAIQPQIEAWVSHHVMPLVSTAAAELVEIGTEHTLKGTVKAVDAVQLGTPGGAGDHISMAIAAIAAGISTMVIGVLLGIETTLWFFTTVSWPILLGGIAGGLVLVGLGAVKASTLKQKVLDGFSGMFIPKIREALVGNGYDHDGRHHLSLRAQLIQHLEEAAEAAERKLQEPQP